MAAKDLVCMHDDDLYQHDWKSARAVNQDEFVLTRVVGLTNISKNALDCNPITGHVAFPASSMLVLLDPKTNDQKYMRNPTGKNISCLSFSDDGRLVALGESGVKPLVSLWSVKDLKELSKFTVDHSVGVKTIAIHPKYNYLVVIGIQDLNIGVWDYVRCNRLALTKWQTVPLSLTIPKSGTSVILCGHRKITLFNLDKVNSNSYETNVFEDKKAVLLGRQSEYTFVDITSGRGKFDKNVYSVTTCGYLCEIRLGDILIDKAIKVDSHAFCVRFALNHVFVGCCQGVVKICNPDSLTVAVAVSLDQLLGSEAFPQVASRLYLDTTAIAVNEKESIVTCIYSNCSIYSWQINNFTDSFECSVLLPSLDDQLENLELDSCVNESVCRANMFRSLMGCIEFSKDSRLFDTETLAARNGMRCHHDLMHVIKGNSTRQQHVTSFRFSPDGRDVICGNEAGEIKVYDACTGVLRRVIEAHSAQVMCIELLYDGDYQLVCTGGRDRIIFILNAKADFSLVQVLCDHSAAITAISLVSHDGLLTLVSAAADNLILVRRATSGNSLKFTVTGQIVESRYNKALNVTGDYIITGDRNGNIKLFKADPIFNPKLSKTLKTIPKGNQITSMPRPMCIDPTGSFIATAQNAGQIVVYHLPTGQPIASLPAQTDATTIKFTNCLRYMVSSTSNGCTMIWRIPERMTDFLVAKRNKTYQIEVAKEVSYETTIVSCVKVCKEMSMRESAKSSDKRDYSRPDSNHNYDTDATPSIESLSFLRDAHDGDGESDRNSVYSTESYISCSTCRESCSDTVNWCRSSDSSIQTNSGTISFNFRDDSDFCGRIIEDSQCKKLGIFRQKSNEAKGKYGKVRFLQSIALL
ncbi:unnamed protein product [Candidula unifasciata]|uniref:Anaphase-promoting complex subunit 4-like WD40 domain-containing protein n=1 Tax=Candidula unifasciata TaxID=100452 RepID=A0A8S3ZH03_9EUPU|nr:unnamed protein product [Candidula unifasciata]